MGVGSAWFRKTCEVKQVKNRIRGRGRVIGHRSRPYPGTECRGRIRIRVKSQRSVAGTGAIGRGQVSKVRVQESKVRTIPRARV